MNNYLPQPIPEYRRRDLLFVVCAIALIFSLYPIASIIQFERQGSLKNNLAPQFELYDAQGKVVSTSDYLGSYVYLMFGFLRCTDVCHTQVYQLESISKALKRPDVHFLYLAIDSQQDKPSALRAYFDQRGTNFVSLNADNLAKMRVIAKSYEASFQVNGNLNSGLYTIEHPARIFVIDPEGKIQFVYFGNSIDEDKILKDFYRMDSTFFKHNYSELL